MCPICRATRCRGAKSRASADATRPRAWSRPPARAARPCTGWRRGRGSGRKPGNDFNAVARVGVSITPRGSHSSAADRAGAGLARIMSDGAHRYDGVDAKRTRRRRLQPEAHEPAGGAAPWTAAGVGTTAARAPDVRRLRSGGSRTRRCRGDVDGPAALWRRCHEPRVGGDALPIGRAAWTLRPTRSRGCRGRARRTRARGALEVGTGCGYRPRCSPDAAGGLIERLALARRRGQPAAAADPESSPPMATATAAARSRRSMRSLSPLWRPSSLACCSISRFGGGRLVIPVGDRRQELRVPECARRR
jgi:hypothetical protein